MDKTLAWLWLADAVGSACQNARDLLALYPDPEALYEALCAGREAPPYFLSDHAVAQLCDTTPFDYEERLDHCLLTGVEIITPDDAAYPDRLRDLPDMPLVLYVTGEPRLPERPPLVAGGRPPAPPLNGGRWRLTFRWRWPNREPSLSAVWRTVSTVRATARRWKLAHLPWRSSERPSIRPTPPPMSSCASASRKAAAPSAASTRPATRVSKRGTFLARNRLIAGLSEVLCVAEARIRSGTLNTVSHAESLGRPVLAVPGSIYSAQSQGTNELLRSGRAGVLCQAADVLACMGVESESAAPEQSAFAVEQTSPDAQAVYAALGPTPKGVDELAAATGLSASRVLAACTELELYGGAQSQPGRRYVAL